MDRYSALRYIVARSSSPSQIVDAVADRGPSHATRLTSSGDSALVSSSQRGRQRLMTSAALFDAGPVNRSRKSPTRGAAARRFGGSGGALRGSAQKWWFPRPRPAQAVDAVAQGLVGLTRR